MPQADIYTAAGQVSSSNPVPVTLSQLVSGEDQTNDALKIRRRTTWQISHLPAANTRATISRAAGGAGVKHVLRSFTATFSADTTAPAAINVAVQIRDGATGAGTVLYLARISLPAVGGQSAPPLQLSGLWLEGSENTAMTIEFSAAGGANTFETVWAEGEDIS